MNIYKSSSLLFFRPKVNMKSLSDPKFSEVAAKLAMLAEQHTKLTNKDKETGQKEEKLKQEKLEFRRKWREAEYDFKNAAFEKIDKAIALGAEFQKLKKTYQEVWKQLKAQRKQSAKPYRKKKKIKKKKGKKLCQKKKNNNRNKNKNNNSKSNNSSRSSSSSTSSGASSCSSSARTTTSSSGASTSKNEKKQEELLSWTGLIRSTAFREEFGMGDRMVHRYMEFDTHKKKVRDHWLGLVA